MVRSAGVSPERIATLLLAAWAGAFWLSEGLLQAVADASLLTAAVLVARGASLPRHARGPVVAALALAGWQALSPLVVRALGAPGFPPAALWLHCLDTAALAAAALLGAQVARWTWPGALFVAGGLASLGLSAVQHLVRWSIPIPAVLRVPVDRVHETFGGEDRYAAGGFFFHRLRLAHASVAALGPALAAALRAPLRSGRALGAVLAAACIGCIVLAYARAALLTALLLVLVAAVAVARSNRVRAAVLGVLLAVAAVATASPGWRARFAAAAENFQGGERALARTAGWDLIHQRPWLGVGFGNYRQAALERRGVTGITDQLSRDAHSIALTVWAETGVPGLVLWLVLQASLLVALLRRARADKVIALGGTLSWLGYHVLGVAHFLPFHPSVALDFALVWGVALVYPGACGTRSASSGAGEGRSAVEGRAVDGERLPGAALPGEGAGAFPAGRGPPGP
jgi:O-antigen ligase